MQDAHAGSVGSSASAGETSMLALGSAGFGSHTKDGGVAADWRAKDGGATTKAPSLEGNHSTTLGDGTSGQYTGGKGTTGEKTK